MGVFADMTTETRWAIGIMATIGAAIITIILGFQATVDDRQDEAHKELAAVVLMATKQLERATEKLDIIDKRGTTSEQLRVERQAERTEEQYRRDAEKWQSGQKR